jgi:mycothiol synthase
MLDLDLRQATLEDAPIVADLEAARAPDDPRDPILLRFWWESNVVDKVMRRVATRDGAAVAFTAAGHEPWEHMPQRFGWVRSMLHPARWSDSGFASLIATAEDWLRAEGAITSVARVREDFGHELEMVKRQGYREERRQNTWELDLVEGRDRLLAAAEVARNRIRETGVSLLTVSDDHDPELMTKLYEMTIAAEKDIPTSVPWRTMTIAEWAHVWFDNPAVRRDRFWIAREGDSIIGVSVLDFPVTRGLPWTSFTGTSAQARGRGIARALKLETIAQAIALGFTRVRTSNDGANGPILHLNQEMGYRLVTPVIELHRRL